MRILFVNEGGLGGHAMGHLATERALRAGAALHPDVEARFIRLPDMSRRVAIACASLPPLKRYDLDLGIARWHAVQAVRVRALVRAAVSGWTPDAIHVDSHTIAFGLGSEMRRTPTFVVVDATVRQWRDTALLDQRRPWSDLALAPSLAAERRVLRRAAGVLAMSGWSAAGVHAEEEAAAVTVLHPGIDTARFRPAGPGGAAPRRRAGPMRLLFVGGRFVEKGGTDLVDAVADILGDRVEIDAVTAAPVDTRPGLRVHRLRPDDPRLLELFQAADLLCLPSRADAVPWVVPEALACGTPVVVSDTGALPAMADGAGAVVPAGDVGALRRTVLALLDDPARLAALRARARPSAEEHYDLRRQFDRLIGLIGDATC